MNKISIKIWMPVLCVLAGMLVSCSNEDTSSNITPTQFHLERDLANYSSTDNFTWETSLDQVLATIRIRNFTHGDTTIRVFDARGKQILSRYLFTPNSTIYLGGNDFLTTVLSKQATPGTWRVELRYSQFTGDIDLAME